jgi:hypothetical protein
MARKSREIYRSIKLPWAGIATIAGGCGIYPSTKKQAKTKFNRHTAVIMLRTYLYPYLSNPTRGRQQEM